VSRAYFELVRLCAEAGLSEIIVNFADLGGLVSAGLGATAFATGPSANLRALHIEGYMDEGGGIALPHYYSHKTVGEYLSETDVDHIAGARAFRRIVDRTPFSMPLVDAVLRGESASDLPAWAESQNNYGMAHKHAMQRLVDEGNRLRRLGTTDDRYNAILDWLEAAEANALFVSQRLHRNGHTTDVGRRAPTQTWLGLLET
jgi:hypothetical protein